MIDEYFKNQIEQGATKTFWYGLETGSYLVENIKINITNHKGALDTFPTNLEFIRMLSESLPLFKEVE
jgi:hypothetical protein